MLSMAVLAWVTFTAEAMTQRLDLPGEPAAQASMMSGGASCDDAAMAHPAADAAQHPASAHPFGHDHNCCQSAHCYCASQCSGVIGGSSLKVALQPVHDPASSLTYTNPVPVRSAPPLRPPIA